MSRYCEIGPITCARALAWLSAFRYSCGLLLLSGIRHIPRCSRHFRSWVRCIFACDMAAKGGSGGNFRCNVITSNAESLVSPERGSAKGGAARSSPGDIICIGTVLIFLVQARSSSCSAPPEREPGPNAWLPTFWTRPSLKRRGCSKIGQRTSGHRGEWW
jgi:hypothetical protein